MNLNFYVKLQQKVNIFNSVPVLIVGAGFDCVQTLFLIAILIVAHVALQASHCKKQRYLFSSAPCIPIKCMYDSVCM
jgi:hypothetical protein